MSSGAELLEDCARLAWPAIGESRQGRPIAAACLGSGARRPLIVMAGIHGNEQSGVTAVLELAVALADAAVSAPDRPIWLVPALNPDGLLHNQKNSAGDVDLNRNFPARNFATQHAPGYSPGAAPLSEPETRAFAALFERIQPAAVVTVHAPFACINFDGPAPGWAERVARACGWPARADIGYPTPGSLGTWLGVDRGVPVLTIELPPGPYQTFAVPARAALRAAVEGAPD